MSTQSRLFSEDDYLVVWTLAWGAHALVTAPWRIFHANRFYPSTLSLAYSEHLLGYAPIFGPPYWATGNPILGVNVVILLSYPLCALAMYLLARRFMSGAAAAVAGFFYSFCVWRFRILQIHLLGVQFMPLALLLTERWFEQGRGRDAALLALALILQALSSLYLAYTLALVYGPYLLAALWRWRALCDRRRLIGLSLVLALALIVTGAASLPHVELRRLGLIPSYPSGSEDFRLQPLMTRLYLRAEGVGVVGYALALVALLPPWRERRWPCVMGVLAATIGTVTAFGPDVQIGGSVLWTPYRVLMEWVPGFGSVRVPSRFVCAAQLGFALLAGLGLERVLGHLPHGGRWAVAGVTVALALRSFGTLPAFAVRVAPTGDAVPAAYRWLAQHGEGRPLLELPPGNNIQATRRLYLSTFHWLPIIEGNPGYRPRTAEDVYRSARDLPAESALQAVVDLVDIGWILVHRKEMPGASSVPWSGPLPPGLERAGEWGDDLLLRVTVPRSRR